MDLDRFAQESEGHCEELKSELREYGIERLSVNCVSLGMDNMLRHIADNAPLMAQYIAHTPSQRLRKHRELEGRDRAVFVLGALYLARSGSALLRAAAGIQQAPPSYRRVSGHAATAAWALSCPLPLWPFPDQTDPFDRGDG